MFTLVVLYRGISCNHRVSLAARMRGLTRTLSCSLAMHSRQTTYVALCSFEGNTPSVQRCITRELPPPHPVLKPSHCRTIRSRSSTTTNLTTSSSAAASGEKSAATTMDAGPSNSFHLAGAPATTSMALRRDTPPRKRCLARTYCRYVSRPASQQPPPQGITQPPPPRTDLSDTSAIYTVGGCGLVFAPKLKWG